MTGSAVQAMDVVLALILGEKVEMRGRVPGRGGAKIGPGRSLADFSRYSQTSILMRFEDVSTKDRISEPSQTSLITVFAQRHPSQTS